MNERVSEKASRAETDQQKNQIVENPFLQQEEQNPD